MRRGNLLSTIFTLLAGYVIHWGIIGIFRYLLNALLLNVFPRTRRSFLILAFLLLLIIFWIFFKLLLKVIDTFFRFFNSYCFDVTLNVVIGWFLERSHLSFRYLFRSLCNNLNHLKTFVLPESFFITYSSWLFFFKLSQDTFYWQHFAAVPFRKLEMVDLFFGRRVEVPPIEGQRDV